MRLCSLWSATFVTSRRARFLSIYSSSSFSGLNVIARARAARFLSIHSSSSFSGLNDFLFVFPIKLISWVFRMLTSDHSAIHPEYLSKTAILVNWPSLVFSSTRVPKFKRFPHLYLLPWLRAPPHPPRPPPWFPPTLRFKPIYRNHRDGSAPLCIGHFADRSRVGIAAANAVFSLLIRSPFTCL